MRKNQIGDYIRKYILPHHKNYYVDQYVMYKTFGNNFFIKGYLFYSKGDSEMGLKVTLFVMPLFIREDRIAYTLGKELFLLKKEGLFKKIKNIWWDVRKEVQEETFEAINQAIESQGETVLKKFESSKDFFEYHKKERKDNIRVYESIAYSSIFFASIDMQNKLLKGLINEAVNERDVDWVHQIKSEAELLLEIETISGRITVLKRWANETIGNLKLPKLKPFSF